MKKDELRDNLFNKYFEETNEIVISDFLDEINDITTVWKKIHGFLEVNVNNFDKTSTLSDINDFLNKGRKFLIIKLRCYNYIIIDIENNKSLTKEEVIPIFNNKFFQNNFNDALDKNLNFTYFYNYEGDIGELVRYYFENKEILKLPRKIVSSKFIGKAKTALVIDIANGKSLLYFRTPSQSLYEHLFLDVNLNPLPMQDAVDVIGRERLAVMFSKIPYIRVPLDDISAELYDYYLKKNAEDNVPYQRSLKKCQK